jgi:hypothetical protein
VGRAPEKTRPFFVLIVELLLLSVSTIAFLFTTGHFLSNARIPDAATCCSGLVAKTNSANHVFASPKRQQVGASVKVPGSELFFCVAQVFKR